MASSSKARRGSPAPLLIVLSLWVLPFGGNGVGAEELRVPRVESSDAGSAPAIARYSERSLRLAIEVDRDGARVLAFTLKGRPFERPLPVPEAKAANEDGRLQQIEVALLGPRDQRVTQRFDIGPICFRHPAGAEPHVTGDTIVVHRDSFVVGAPELPGFDRVEVAYHTRERDGLVRRPLAIEPLDAPRFTPAGTPARYGDLVFAEGDGKDESSLEKSGRITWPEQIGDPDIYQVFGDEAETDRRLNIIIVPDGYTPFEVLGNGGKALMETHAQNVVNSFRAKTPYKEHDPFINYILVYAYSSQNGTDQCDCSVLTDTAMATRFPMSVPTCGDSANRCLYYGTGCDSDTSSNIALAEMRAPDFDYSQGDRTLVMVNTSRYGGCGGFRAVYSAANSAAHEVAIHELGHAVGGLADEYQGNPACGPSAGEINTSLDPVNGAWPEWIAQVGAPREGGQTYDECVYRPTSNCEMRSLNQPFCPVCNQRWALVFFGKPRINPTAPVESLSPSSPLSVPAGVPVDFSVSTRLAIGAVVTNEFTWEVQEPGQGFATVATGTPAHNHTFSTEGMHEVRCTVVADTNFVKPSKYGSNVDVATWTVDVTAAVPTEVSPPGTTQPLRFVDPSTLSWEDGSFNGASSFNLYRGDLAALPGTYGSCLEPGISANSTTDATSPPAGTCWTYLVSGKSSGGEGPLGEDSEGTARTDFVFCP